MQTFASLQKAFDDFLKNEFPTISISPEQSRLTLNTHQGRAQFGDLSTNVALQLAKQEKKSPKDIGNIVANRFKHEAVSKIEIAGIGFVNFFLTPKSIISAARELFVKKESIFKDSALNPRKILIEFVSANPTGPLHFGHGRNGIIGDVLGNILSFIGHSVTKEFYVNDAGKQMQRLAMSLIIRCQQQLGIAAELPADGYQGEYLKDVAHQCIGEYGIKVLENPESFFAHYAQEKILNQIKKTLKLYNIEFDNWFFESILHENGSIEQLISLLIKKGLAYEKDGALWFGATEFDDDKDRVIRKTNGELTYLAADIAYLKNKFDRGYQQLIMVLGHDHHSFATRLQAIRKALDLSCTLDIILYQLVRIKEGSQDFKMSKRSGRMLFLEDVIEAVGTDAARFFYSHKKADAPLEFDLELALKKTDENPLFYIQYAYVRIQSILKKSFEISGLININEQDALFLEESDFLLLKKNFALGKTIEQIAETLEPHTLSLYAIELAQAFHAYYATHKIIDPDNLKTSRARLFLLYIVKTNISICLNLLGLSKPEKM